MRETRLGPLLADLDRMYDSEWLCLPRPLRLGPLHFNRWTTVIVVGDDFLDGPPPGYTARPDGTFRRDRDGTLIHPDLDKRLITDIAINLTAQIGRDLDVATFIRGVRHYVVNDAHIDLAAKGAP